MTERKLNNKLPWGPREARTGAIIHNVRIHQRLGILEIGNGVYMNPPRGSEVHWIRGGGFIAVPPTHYQPPQDTLRFLPDYREAVTRATGSPTKK